MRSDRPLWFVSFLALICISATRASAIENKSAPARIELTTTLEPRAIQGTQEIELELGDQVCNRELNIVWTIHNPLEESVDWPRVTSSCGCITNVPKAFQLAARESDTVGSKSEIVFQIRLPNRPEELHKQIVFWDGLGNAKLQATLKSNVTPPILLDHDVIALDSNEPTVHEIKLKAANKSIDLRKYQLVTSAVEVTELQLIAKDEESGTLRLQIDPKKSSEDTVRALPVLEMICDGTTECHVPYSIHFEHRTSIVPKQVFFQKIADRYECRFTVLSPKLIRQLAKKEPLEVRPPAKTKAKLDGKAEVLRTNASNCQVLVTISTPSIGQGPIQFDLVCGDWQTTLSCERP